MPAIDPPAPLPRLSGLWLSSGNWRRIKEGENNLEIRYTTTLANYANSLTGNEAAERWANLQQPDPMGLSGDIRLLKSR